MSINVKYETTQRNNLVQFGAKRVVTVSSNFEITNSTDQAQITYLRVTEWYRELRAPQIILANLLIGWKIVTELTYVLFCVFCVSHDLHYRYIIYYWNTELLLFFNLSVIFTNSSFYLGDVDCNLAYSSRIFVYNTWLWETQIQEMVPIDVYYVHRVDWFIILCGGLDDNNYR